MRYLSRSALFLQIAIGTLVSGVAWAYPDCAAPVITTPTEGQVFTKGPMILTMKPGQSAKPLPSNLAMVSIDRVGGGNAFFYPMELNKPYDFTTSFGPFKPDGSFEDFAYATYKITAQISSKDSVIPGCDKSAPRTFKIAAPSQVRIQRPSKLVYPEKPRPIDPPPVERQQQQIR